jgi:hypothetical protein
LNDSLWNARDDSSFVLGERSIALSRVCSSFLFCFSLSSSSSSSAADEYFKNKKKKKEKRKTVGARTRVHARGNSRKWKWPRVQECVRRARFEFVEFT